MADRHETGEYQPDYFPHADESQAPSCKGCVRALLLLADLQLPHDDPEKRYVINKDLARHMREVAERSPDWDAFTAEMMRNELCPLSMLSKESPGQVAATVPLGECAVFDCLYRPGVQAKDI
jgi:hypothetical protein